MKHIKRYNESKYTSDLINQNPQSYKLVEDFLKEELGNYMNPVDQEDLPDLLVSFGKKVWIHLSEQGWGESSLEGYEEWLNGKFS